MNTFLKEQKLQRLDLLQRSLGIASEGNVKLKGVTQLSKFCTGLIQEWERNPLEESIPRGVLVTKRSAMSWKTLLRGDYRVFLDIWIEVNSPSKKIDRGA